MQAARGGAPPVARRVRTPRLFCLRLCVFYVLFPRRGALAPPSWACHRLSLFPLLSFVSPSAVVPALPSPLTAPAVCGTLAATFVRGGWRLRPAPPFAAHSALCAAYSLCLQRPLVPPLLPI